MADIFVRDANLASLMEKTGYNITQENGQRKFGPPPGWMGPPPPKGSQIFIGKLPRYIYEDELLALCEQFGKIYELRLMMEFNGENRGYSFVTYTNIDDATKAIKHLDDYEIRPGRHIGVCKSMDNRRLFVGGIPKDKSKEEIMAEISKYTEGVSKVILYSSIVDKSKNRGFAFVEYESHLAAAMARRRLLSSQIKLFDHDIAVDWAQPEAQVEEETINRIPVIPKNSTYEEETLMYSMPIYLDTTGRQSRISGSSSSSSLLSTTWKYTAYKWVKKNRDRHERKFQHKKVNEFNTPAVTDYFPTSSSFSSLESAKIVEESTDCRDVSSPLKKILEMAVCVICGKKKLKYPGLKFTNLECFHSACRPCSNILFRRTSSLPVSCPKCLQVIRRMKNRDIDMTTTTSVIRR